MTPAFKLIKFFTVSAIPALTPHVVELLSSVLLHTVVLFAAAGRCTGARRRTRWTVSEFCRLDGAESTHTNTSRTTTDAQMCQTTELIIDNVQDTKRNIEISFTGWKNLRLSTNSFYEPIAHNIRKQ